MANNTDYTFLLETRLDDEALRLMCVMLSALIKEYGGLDEVIVDLNRMRDNFNYNSDRILEELRKNEQ